MEKMNIPPQSIDRVIGIINAYTTRVGGGPFPTELNDRTGEHIASIGKEFGATTGRPRRCGGFDAVVARYAVMIGGINEWSLMKLDVLDNLKEIKMCIGYEIDGNQIDYLPAALNDQLKVKPIYKTFPGWKSSTQGVRNMKDLPENAKNYMKSFSNKK